MLIKQHPTVPPTITGGSEHAREEHWNRRREAALKLGSHYVVYCYSGGLDDLMPLETVDATEAIAEFKRGWVTDPVVQPEVRPRNEDEPSGLEETTTVEIIQTPAPAFTKLAPQASQEVVRRRSTSGQTKVPLVTRSPFDLQPVLKVHGGGLVVD